MRTDSPNFSEGAVKDIRTLAAGKNWPVPPMPRTWKSKEAAQKARKAIRPAHLEEVKSGKKDQEISFCRLIPAPGGRQPTGGRRFHLSQGGPKPIRRGKRLCLTP
jgi:hypothetical protein